jgi:Set1/Ash2 histone methyltransferase complex subunit ASH2
MPVVQLASLSKNATSSEVDLTRKKGKKHGRRTARTEDSVEASLSDFVRVIPFTGQADDDVGTTVRLSTRDKANGLELSSDRQAVTGWKGFRSVRATHGFHQGTYYCEVTVDRLGETGHCRLGWSTKQSEKAAPVGYDCFGCGYRDVDGTKVHKALREQYGQPFGEGDVLGLFLHLPEGGRAFVAGAGMQLARFKGALYEELPDQAEPEPLQGSVLAFTRNGVLQGVAYRDVLEGTYFPTASLYTLPEQKEGAKVTFNFGPDFKYPPPSIEGCPAAEPVSALPAQQQAAAEAEEAAALAAAGAAAAAAGPGVLPEGAGSSMPAGSSSGNPDAAGGPEPAAAAAAAAVESAADVPPA